MFFLDSSSGLEHLAGLLRAFGMLYAALVAEQGRVVGRLGAHLVVVAVADFVGVVVRGVEAVCLFGAELAC